jgi:hypothetical protein
MPIDDSISKEELKAALRESANRTAELLIREMGTRFAELTQRLDRMDSTLANLTKHVAAGTSAIAGSTEWTSKADADYARVLAELADLKLRLAKLENPGA